MFAVLIPNSHIPELHSSVSQGAEVTRVRGSRELVNIALVSGKNNRYRLH